MKFNARKASLALPGVTGTARVGKPTSTLLPRLRPGDIAVIDHVDLDRDTATALVDAGVRGGRERRADDLRALRQPRARGAGRGRRPRRRPGRQRRRWTRSTTTSGSGSTTASCTPSRPRATTEELAIGRAPRPGARARRDGPGPLRAGRPARHPGPHHQRLPAPRAGAAAQRSGAARAGHPARRAPGRRGRRTPSTATCRRIRQFVREQAPVVVAVGAAADDVLGLSWAPDVVVVTAGEPGSVPSADALRVATDVILLAPRGVEPRRAGGDRGRRRRPAPGRLLGHRRGHRAPARRPPRRRPGRRRRAARPARGLPRPSAGRHGQQLRHPAQGRVPAGRRGAPSGRSTPPGPARCRWSWCCSPA